MKYSYPAIFTNDEAGWLEVHFADHEDWFTCGRNIKEAVEYAVDILNIKLLELATDGKPFPEPVSLDSIALEDNQLVRLITADIDEYSKIVAQIDNNPIRYAREQANLSIKEMADHLDVPYRTAQEWNAGRVRPPRWCERLIFDKIMELKD